MASRHVICRLSELPPGERRIVEIDRRSIGIFNVGGDLFAVRNRCPHRGAPLCRGVLADLVTGSEPYRYEIAREGQILRCPWHGWEFDLATGQSVFNPHRVRVKRYEVAVEPPEPDPTVATFPVSIEEDEVVLYC